ncbi:MAG: FAD-dependent oxidoreductase [Clostridiales bacterium]|nr:FAD-dependent oxidoreductase [Clostridiales bacterium]
MEKGIFDEYEKCLQDEPAATAARCPVHVDVPALCAGIAGGDFAAAYETLQKRMPFAGVFCLVCDAPCEKACVRGALDAPVRVGELERAAVRYGRAPLKKKPRPPRRKGTAAVIGGGISGLAAAYDLDRRGFDVVIFEKSRRLGGWLWELEGKGIEGKSIEGKGTEGKGFECEAVEGKGFGCEAVEGKGFGCEAVEGKGIESKSIEAKDIEDGLKDISELSVEVRCGQFVDDQMLKQLEDSYDVVLLSTGAWDRLPSVDPATLRAGAGNLFACGSLAGTGESLIGAVSSGKRAAVTMERFVKKVSLTAEREREGPFETLLIKNLEYVEPVSPVEKGGPSAFYTSEEARREAARCLRCECDECLKACAHMQRYGRRPKTYAREIYTNENVFLGTRYANKMINSCTLCGLCGERCPIGLSMAPLVERTRRSMVESGKMPPSAHDFALRDMAFSNSGACALVRQPPGKAASGAMTPTADVPERSAADAPERSAADAPKAPYMFFPGCQLAASAPGHVEAAYAWLRGSLQEGVCIALGCCGAPADWAGRDDLLDETISSFRAKWEDEGRPTLILACSSCMDVFSRLLPEIPQEALWHVIAERGLPGSASQAGGKTLSIHDACATRHDAALQADVRSIVSGLGYGIEELRYSGGETKCCGYGGLVFFANREQEGDFAAGRAEESPHDLLVYCAMCKDLFIGAGKRSFHLLDLLFAEDVEAWALKRMPTLSERQANRAELKRRLLRDVFCEGAPVSETAQGAATMPGLDGYTVGIAPAILTDMDEKLILDTDVFDALALAAAKPEECFYNKKDGSYLISIHKQYGTYWVRYTLGQKHMEVVGVYSHRMEVLG